MDWELTIDDLLKTEDQYLQDDSFDSLLATANSSSSDYLAPWDAYLAATATTVTTATTTTSSSSFTATSTPSPPSHFSHTSRSSVSGEASSASEPTPPPSSDPSLRSFAFPDASAPCGEDDDSQLLRDAQQRIFAQLHSTGAVIPSSTSSSSSYDAAAKPFKLKSAAAHALLGPPPPAPSSNAAVAAVVVDTVARAGLPSPPASSAGSSSGGGRGKSIPPIIAPKALPPGSGTPTGPAPGPSRSVGMARSASSSGGSDAGGSAGEKDYKKKPSEVQGHNAVEKRYRENINGQIAALRHLVPALRHLSPDPTTASVDPSMTAAATAAGGRAAVGQLVDGVYVPSKLSKSLILAKSIEYILALQLQRRHLSEDLASLTGRVEHEVDRGTDVVQAWRDEREAREQGRKAEREKVAREGIAAQDVANPTESSASAKRRAPFYDHQELEDDVAEMEQRGKRTRLAGVIDPSLLFATAPTKLAFAVFGGLAFASSRAGFDYLSTSRPTGQSGDDSSAAWSVASPSSEIGLSAAAAGGGGGGGGGTMMTLLALFGAFSLILALVRSLLPSSNRSRASSDARAAAARRTRKIRGLKRLLALQSYPLSLPSEVVDAGDDEAEPEGLRRMRDVRSALRDFVDGPSSSVEGAAAVVAEAAAWLTGGRRDVAKDEAAAWVRLLEIECSPVLSFPRLETLHTFLRVANLRATRAKGLASDKAAALLAIHNLRNATWPDLLSQKLWAAAADVSAQKAKEKKDDGSDGDEAGEGEGVEAEWTRLAVATPFEAMRQVALSRADLGPGAGTMPLLRLAERAYGRALVDTWSKIFVSVVQTTTLAPPSTSSTSASSSSTSSNHPAAAASASLAELAKAASVASGADPALVGDAIALIDRAVTRVLGSTLEGTEMHALAAMTAGVWRTAFGDAETAAELAAELVRGKWQARLRSVRLFLCLVDEEQPSSSSSSSPVDVQPEEEDEAKAGRGKRAEAKDRVSEIETLAEAALEWLLISRRFAVSFPIRSPGSSLAPPARKEDKALGASTLRLRRLLADPLFRAGHIVAASVGEPPEQRRRRGLEREFDIADAVDLCVDGLTRMARRCAGLSDALGPGEDDSGYESL